MVTVVFNIIFVSLLCFGLINNARKAETAEQQEMKMADTKEVREIVDKKTGKSYTFNKTSGGHFRHVGPRGSFSMQAHVLDNMDREILIGMCKQYE